MVHAKPSIAIDYAKDKLYSHGREVDQATWQSTKSPDKTIELLNHIVSFPIPRTKEELVSEIKPNLAWADEHFTERIGGIPLNPPPSHERWPFAVKSNGQFTQAGQFSHTYPERFWPRKAAVKTPYETNVGLRYELGDYHDLLLLLAKDLTTRQAFLPIWFPEDLTAAKKGERVPCTLGYHFIVRGHLMHINYYIRSCDIIRHFRDDIYLACRLLQHTISMVISKEPDIAELYPGMFTMYITSLHCFKNDRPLLLNPKY